MYPKQKFINNSFKFVAILENSWDFIFNKVGLTVKTYGVLHMISTGLDTSKDLLTWTYWSKPNMTKKIKALEENGFIIREIDEKDKRVFRFKTTIKANKALKKISPIYEDIVWKIFEWVEHEELGIAYNVVIKCLENLENRKRENKCN